MRRQLLASSSPPGKGIIWQWEGDVRGQWNTFDMEVACLLEDHFSNPSTQNTELNLSKTAVKLPYIMDLSRMTQKRIETGRLRMIRRELLAMPYMNCNPSDLGSSGSGLANTVQAADTTAVSGSGVKHRKLSGTGQSNSLSAGASHNSVGPQQTSSSAMLKNSNVAAHNSHSALYNNSNTAPHSSNATSVNLNMVSHSLSSASHNANTSQNFNAASYHSNGVPHNMNAISHNSNTASQNMNVTSHNLNPAPYNLSGTSQGSGLTGGPLTRKRLYSHMNSSSSLPTSMHMNSVSHPVSQSHQAANQNASIFPHSQSVTNQSPASAAGFSAVGFPHSNIFQRAASFFHGNISHNSTQPLPLPARTVMAGSSYGNMNYHR